jgi:hypothetical protein
MAGAESDPINEGGSGADSPGPLGTGGDDGYDDPSSSASSSGSCAPGAACTAAVWHCADFCYSPKCCLLSCDCQGGSYSCSIMC